MRLHAAFTIRYILVNATFDGNANVPVGETMHIILIYTSNHKGPLKKKNKALKKKTPVGFDLKTHSSCLHRRTGKFSALVCQS
jgi:hypothetical protein